MFARWDKMSKAFARIGKEITIAVKAGGPNPEQQPGAAPRDPERARASNMPKDKVETAIKRASGQSGADYEEILYEGYAPHGVAVLVETATDNPTRTVANVRVALQQGRRQPGRRPAASASCSSAWACSASNPTGIDAEALELDLIDHGLEEMGEGTGEKGEPQLVIRCAFARLRPAAEGARGAEHHAALGGVGVHPVDAGRAARGAGHRGAQADRHARAGRRRPEGVPQPRLTVVHRYRQGG